MKPMLLWLEHVLGFEQLWEVEFHTSDVDPEAQDRLGPQVDRDVGPGVAAPSSRTTSRRARSSRARRSTSSTRSCAATACSTSRSRSATSSRAVRGLRGARRHVHADAGQLLRHAARADRRRAASSEIDEDLDDPARARDPGRRRSRPRVHAADLPQGGGGPLRRSERRARSSTRSSSARATAASAPATSARCSRASSASSSERRDGLMLDRMQRRRRRAQAPHRSCAAPTARSASRSASRATASTARTRSSTTCAGRTRTGVAPAQHGWAAPGRRGRARAREAPLPHAASSPRQGGPQIDARVAAAVQRRPDRRRRVPDAPTIRSTSPTATPTSSSTSTRAAARCAALLGDVAFAQGDYVFVPRGLLHRFLPDAAAQHWLWFSLTGGVHVPKQWRNEVGQLRMDAPYSHRDFQRPAVRRRRATRASASSSCGAAARWHGFTLEDSPLDVVGWDGTVYPWAFPILRVPAARRARCTCRRRGTARSPRAAR